MALGRQQRLRLLAWENVQFASSWRHHSVLWVNGWDIKPDTLTACWVTQQPFLRLLIYYLAKTKRMSGVNLLLENASIEIKYVSVFPVLTLQFNSLVWFSGVNTCIAILFFYNCLETFWNQRVWLRRIPPSFLLHNPCFDSQTLRMIWIMTWSHFIPQKLPQRKMELTSVSPDKTSSSEIRLCPSRKSSYRSFMCFRTCRSESKRTMGDYSLHLYSFWR